MRIAIIGPGAVGSLFGAYLTAGGLEVTLLDHRAERAEKLNRSGIHIHGVRGEHHVPVRVSTNAQEVGPVDLVLVCVKAYHTQTAIQQHRTLIGDSTTIWTLQNGLGNIEALSQIVPSRLVVGGSTTIGVNSLGPGNLHHAGEGDTWIGELNADSSPRVEQIAKLMTQAGLAVKVSPDIRKQIWTKLLVNVGINALTAILRVRNGVLLEHPPALQIMEALVAEAVQAAAASGISFNPTDSLTRVKEVAKRTGANRSSMLVDILHGRRTEVDQINGAIPKIVPSPVNQTITSLVRILEASSANRIEPFHEPDKSLGD